MRPREARKRAFNSSRADRAPDRERQGVGSEGEGACASYPHPASSHPRADSCTARPLHNPRHSPRAASQRSPSAQAPTGSVGSCGNSTPRAGAKDQHRTRASGLQIPLPTRRHGDSLPFMHRSLHALALALLVTPLSCGRTTSPESAAPPVAAMSSSCAVGVGFFDLRLRCTPLSQSKRANGKLPLGRWLPTYRAKCSPTYRD